VYTKDKRIAGSTRSLHSLARERSAGNELGTLLRVPRGLAGVLRDLIAALQRVASAESADDPLVPLKVGAREAAALGGAALIVIRLPDGPLSHLDMRVPETGSRLSDRQVDAWYQRAIRRRGPENLILKARRTRPSSNPSRSVARSAGRRGVLMPLALVTGGTGALVAFARGTAPFTRGACESMLVIAQAAVAKAEAIRLRSRTEVLALTEARDRVAREIHDGPLQMLSQMLLRLRLAQRQGESQVRAAMADTEGELKLTVSQMRGLIRTLRVVGPEVNLRERVRTALARLERTRGLSCTLQWREPDGALTARASDETFHVINEALANVYRHSLAKHVHLSGIVRGGTFEVVVRDDGIGFNVAAALRRDLRSLSFGLLSMQERMAAVGGTVSFRSTAGRGTRVRLTIPLAQRALRKPPSRSGKSD
jgi:signal transduction histidine kinase